MCSIKKTYGLRNDFSILSTLEAANRFANRCEKLHIVVLGANEKFWVVCFADAQCLVKAGYEVAN